MSESARHWGALWGDRPRAWARNEEQQTPVYEQALERVGLERGDRVLDVGCGTGVFLRLCADRGADVSGLDASEGLLEIARERVPEADLRLGDLQTLPYADDAFDLVTGFTSFFFAEDMVAALREAGRVARPGRADRDPGLRPPGALRPRGDEGGGGHVPRRGPPVLLAAGDRRGTRDAGRADGRARVRLDVGVRVPGQRSLVEHMLAAGGAGYIAGPEREGEMREAIRDALAHCRQAGRQLPRGQRVARDHR